MSTSDETGVTCVACRTAKVKCDKVQPCSRCNRIGLTCKMVPVLIGRPPGKRKSDEQGSSSRSPVRVTSRETKKPNSAEKRTAVTVSPPKAKAKPSDRSQKKLADKRPPPPPPSLAAVKSSSGHVDEDKVIIYEVVNGRVTRASTSAAAAAAALASLATSPRLGVKRNEPAKTEPLSQSKSLQEKRSTSSSSAQRPEVRKPSAVDRSKSEDIKREDTAAGRKQPPAPRRGSEAARRKDGEPQVSRDFKKKREDGGDRRSPSPYVHKLPSTIIASMPTDVKGADDKITSDVEGRRVSGEEDARDIEAQARLSAVRKGGKGLWSLALKQSAADVKDNRKAVVEEEGTAGDVMKSEVVTEDKELTGVTVGELEEMGRKIVASFIELPREQIQTTKALAVLRAWALCAQSSKDMAPLAPYIGDLVKRATGLELKVLLESPDVIAQIRNFGSRGTPQQQSPSLAPSALDPFLNELYRGPGASLAFVAVNGQHKIWCNENFLKDCAGAGQDGKEDLRVSEVLSRAIGERDREQLLQGVMRVLFTTPQAACEYLDIITCCSSSDDDGLCLVKIRSAVADSGQYFSLVLNLQILPKHSKYLSDAKPAAREEGVAATSRQDSEVPAPTEQEQPRKGLTRPPGVTPLTCPPIAPGPSSPVPLSLSPTAQAMSPSSLIPPSISPTGPAMSEMMSPLGSDWLQHATLISPRVSDGLCGMDSSIFSFKGV